MRDFHGLNGIFVEGMFGQKTSSDLISVYFVLTMIILNLFTLLSLSSQNALVSLGILSECISINLVYSPEQKYILAKTP